MPALQVRDFPATLYDELKEYAARNHRSIAQQTIIAVEEMLSGAGSSALLDGALGPCASQVARREMAPACSLEDRWSLDRTVDEACVRRRQRIFADFDTIDWKEAPSASEDIVAFVNEGRNDRTERIMASVDSPDFDE